jgi:hypothetical protein
LVGAGVAKHDAIRRRTSAGFSEAEFVKNDARQYDRPRTFSLARVFTSIQKVA